MKTWKFYIRIWLPGSGKIRWSDSSVLEQCVPTSGEASPLHFGEPELSMISHLPLVSSPDNCPILSWVFFSRVVEGWLTGFKTKLMLGSSVSSSFWSPQCPLWQALVSCLLNEWKAPHNVVTTCLWHFLSHFFSNHVDFLASLWFKLPNCTRVQDGGLGTRKEECSLHCPFKLWLKAHFIIPNIYQIIIRLIAWQPLSLLLAGAIQLIYSADTWMGMARRILPKKKSTSQKNTQAPKHCTCHTHIPFLSHNR